MHLIILLTTLLHFSFGQHGHDSGPGDCTALVSQSLSGSSTCLPSGGYYEPITGTDGHCVSPSIGCTFSGTYYVFGPVDNCDNWEPFKDDVPLPFNPSRGAWQYDFWHYVDCRPISTTKAEHLVMTAPDGSTGAQLNFEFECKSCLIKVQ